MTIDDIINEVLVKEGGYVNDPNDRGGETNFGITVAVARANGYSGPMKALPRATAFAIYRRRYVEAPLFHEVAKIDPAIAAELVDTGVNLGPKVPVRFLQESLNGLNRQGRDYADIGEDGVLGPASLRALSAYLGKRGAEGSRRLLKLLNALQGARYLDLARGRIANEDFLYGWMERVT